MNDPALKPPFRPKDVSFENIKRATKINLLKILQSYKEFTMKERVSISPRSRSHKSPSSSDVSRNTDYRDRSPLAITTKTTELLHQESDVDTSSDSVFHIFRQPEFTSNELIPVPQSPTPKSSLVTLLNVKPFDPIHIFTPISSNVRRLSTSELSNRDTFLTDTIINAFCVSLINI